MTTRTTKARNGQTRSAAKLSVAATTPAGEREVCSPAEAEATARLAGLLNETRAMKAENARRDAQMKRLMADEKHPQWCEALVRGSMLCGSHMSATTDVVATAGGYESGDDGATFPLFTLYARMFEDGTPGVGVDLRTFRESSDADLTPAEARSMAAALVRYAELAESPAPMLTHDEREAARSEVAS